MQNLDLPEPSPEEKQHSARLSELIRQRIEQQHGWINFEQYMHLALYAPGLGYYSAGLQKFGEAGDFITAPEVSPLFAQSLANPVARLIDEIEDAVLMEFGAGSGSLAAELLKTLNDMGKLPKSYCIVELSAELKQRQQLTLKEQVPELIDRVEWIDRLPATPVNAIVLANEVLDAMPVRRFLIQQGQVEELGVGLENNEMKIQTQPADESLLELLELAQVPLDAETYASEVNPHIRPWIKSLAESCEKCAVYLIDYGYPRSEYYSPERNMGTLMGFYRHRALDQPLWYPGLQDITAFVDFTAVAEAALENGFDVDGFTSQGNFLLDCGLAEIVEQGHYETDIQRLQRVQQMKTLSLPTEMGERFKVLGLSRGLENNIPGFGLRDFRYRL